jgi:hypothetical protein
MTNFRSIGYNTVCFLGVLYYAMFRILIAFCLMVFNCCKYFFWDGEDPSPTISGMKWVVNLYWKFLFFPLWRLLRWLFLIFLFKIGVNPETVFLVTKKKWLGDILDHTEASGFTFSWGILGLSVTATLALLIYLPFLFTASAPVPTVDMSPMEDFD